MTSDPMRVRQCLLNLLSNAAKFTRNGIVDVKVRQEGANGIVFSVSDTGPGLSADQIAHLFQPFTQFHTDQNQGGGTGLGLAITRRLCEALHGEIRVESEVGKGSTFSLHFPLVS
jgi:signal transduction histidine kinase